MEKSAEAYRTISEVAETLKLPQHVLRFWETRFPQVKPLKRGGGRRFYRPEDIDLLRAIKTLLYGDGYTIKGVQRLLKEQGPRALVGMAGQGSAMRTSDQRGRAARPKAAAMNPPGPTPSAPPWVPSPEFGPPAAPQPAGAGRSQAVGSGAGGTPDASARLAAVLAELAECDRILAVAARA